jgi:signal transduction histidine kinase
MTDAVTPATASATNVRASSIRVALAATGVVAIVYLVVSIAVVMLVTRSLTDQIDQRITASFVRLPHDDGGPAGGPYDPPPADRLGGAPILLWQVESDGSVRTATTNPALPAELAGVVGPATATVGGVDLRLAGRQVGDDWVIVGQSLEPVYDTRSTVILAELLIAPILLAAVFFGAVAIGRRVAEPIEAARRRQLDFTADASHELRTPLAVIEAHTSLALAQPRDVVWYRSAFERVDHESRRMRRMLEDLLWLARFDASHRPPNEEPVDLAVMAAQAADRFGPIAETRHLTIDVIAPPDGAVIAAPPEWLDRLLGVLLDNACKYAPDGGRVDLTVTVDGSRVVLTVDDSGPGIPDAERTRIFDRFHRATTAQGGAGLGLAIADAIVRATGGRWRVAAAPTGGARMGVTWTRALA